MDLAQTIIINNIINIYKIINCNKKVGGIKDFKNNSFIFAS